MISGKDIAESEVWKSATAAVRARIHDEFEYAMPSDGGAILVNMSYRLQALNEIKNEVERELTSGSINKPALKRADARPARSGK